MSGNSELIRLTRIGGKFPTKGKKKNDKVKEDKLSKILSEKKELITEDGKFVKAMLSQNEKIIVTDFIESFSKNDDPSKDDLKTAKKILQIGKTFYEFGASDSKLVPLFIPHKLYDQLLAAYIKHDGEPEAFIPKKMFEKIEIKYTTLSNNLNKAYIISENDPIPKGVAEEGSIEQFLKDAYKELDLDKDHEIEVMLAPKIDGISINTGLKNGQFKEPSSRGDKKEGMYVRSLDGYTIADKEHDKFGIQYEAFVTKDDRVEISKALGLEKEYKTNRTAASALINRMSRSDMSKLAKFLHFYPITSEGLDMDYKESIDHIQKFGKVPSDMIDREIIKGNRKELMDEISKYFKKLESARPKLSYAIDGVVITIMKDKYQEKLGRDGSTNNFQIALKFDPAEVIAKVKDVILSDGNLGYKTIMVQLEEPVEVNGFTYSEIQVLSLDQFESLDLYRGDEVKVKQTGDAIPTILKDDECKEGPRLVKLKPSKLCSTCSHELVIEDSKLRCANRECKSIIAGRIAHFFEQIGLDGFNKATAEVLYDELGVRNIKDLYSIREEQLEEIGFEKRAKKLVKGLKESLEKMKDYELLGAIGLDKIRDENSKKILSAVDIDNISNYRYRDLVEMLKEVKGIDKMAYSYAQSLLDYADEIKFLLQLIDPKRTDFKNMKTVGTTGVEPSEDTKQVIRDLGWSLTKGKKFDILLTSSHGRDSKKMTKAKDEGLKIYTESEFIKEYKKDLYK